MVATSTIEPKAEQIALSRGGLAIMRSWRVGNGLI